MQNLHIRIIVEDLDHEIFSEKQIRKDSNRADECFQEAREVLNRIEKYYSVLVDFAKERTEEKKNIKKNKSTKYQPMCYECGQKQYKKKLQLTGNTIL